MKLDPKRGRPPVEKTPRSHRLEVRLTQSHHTKYHRLANDMGRDLSDIVRDLLFRWYIRESSNPED